MTIRHGEPWGEPGGLDADGIVVESDRAARRLIESALDDGRPLPAIGLVGGDLCRTVGGPGDRSRIFGDGMRLPVDLGMVSLDGGPEQPFVAHCFFLRSWLIGPITAVMNAQFRGTWDVAPRSHPNDGRLDVLQCSLGLSDRIKARRRLALGSHVPHPGIVEQRVRNIVLEFRRPQTVLIDGERMGRCRSAALHIVPDAYTVVV